MGKTATSAIAARMTAAQSARKEHIRGIAAIGRQATKRHDQIAAGSGNISDDARDAALYGLEETGDYCRSLVQEETGSHPAEPNKHKVRDHVGKFAKLGSFGHLVRMGHGK